MQESLVVCILKAGNKFILKTYFEAAALWGAKFWWLKGLNPCVILIQMRSSRIHN